MHINNTEVPVSGLLKISSIVLVILSLAIGAVLWAAEARAEARQWAIEQSLVVKTELKERIEKDLVSREEFVIVREGQKYQQEKLERIEKKIDTLTEMIQTKKGK